jgi:hypothetical protein
MQHHSALKSGLHLLHSCLCTIMPCSLREAPGLAAAMRDVLARRLPVGETAEAVWAALWPAEKRRQVMP